MHIEFKKAIWIRKVRKHRLHRQNLPCEHHLAPSIDNCDSSGDVHGHRRMPPTSPGHLRWYNSQLLPNWSIHKFRQRIVLSDPQVMLGQVPPVLWLGGEKEEARNVITGSCESTTHQTQTIRIELS